MLRKGDKIGPYTLINKLGQGTFGVVWLAERQTPITTTRIALKMPLDDDIDLAAIKQEADLWVRACGHPNIIPIIEANIYEGIVVIASEYAPDGSLDGWLKKHGGVAPSIDAAIEMVLGILSGLCHLHAQRIIHRDLKPANILLQGDTPRLADFGVSRLLKTTSLTNTVAGTPAYMAPEAFSKKRNEQTDLWSVGVILYRLLTGRLPFPQSDQPALMAAILSEYPAPLPPTAPVALHQFLNQAFCKNPAQRFKSAVEMRMALLNVVERIHGQDQIATILASYSNYTNDKTTVIRPPRHYSQPLPPPTVPITPHPEPIFAQDINTQTSQRHKLATRTRDVYTPNPFIKWVSNSWAALPDTVEDLIGNNIVSGLLFAFAPILILFLSIFSVGIYIGLYISELLSLESPLASKSGGLAGAITIASMFISLLGFIKFGKLFDDDSTNGSKCLFIYIGFFVGLFIAKQTGTSYFLVPAIGTLIGSYIVVFGTLVNDQYRKRAGLPERRRSPKS